MISKSTIETVFEVARLEEVIGDFVQLKRAGSNLKGLSPFSEEKSPSFMVSPVKQIWKDFSSGKGGNVITFLMEHEHFTYPEAIRYLAKKYNIEIEETELDASEKESANIKESLYLVSEFAQKYFQNILHNTDEGKSIGLSYFKERGFTLDTINKFNLGFSTDSWDGFTNEALAKGYKLEFLEKTGLTIVKEDKRIDRFKGRVIFPILSMSGRVLGFGGRILNSDKKVAKYLNSPESDIYHKSKVLYGIFHAKQSIAKNDLCYLVEGYTDVIQFHQSGIENVVSSSGTALTPDQIRLVSRLTKNITVLFDGDAAGMRASIRGIDLILEEGMNVKICTFPEGEDPDSFAKTRSFDELKYYLENNSKDFIQFKASLLVEESKNDPIKKAELIKDIVVSISKIPDRIKREVYIQECSRIMDISEQVIVDTLAQILSKPSKDIKSNINSEVKVIDNFVVNNSNNNSINILYDLERKIIGILLLYGNIDAVFEDEIIERDQDGNIVIKPTKFEMKVFQRVYMNLHDDEAEFTTPEFKALYEQIINSYINENVFDRERFLSSVSIDLLPVLSDIIMEEEKYSLDNWESKQIYPKTKEQSLVVSQYVTETIQTLRWYLINSLIEERKSVIKNADSTDNVRDYLIEINDYNKLINKFSSQLGRVLHYMSSKN